MCPPTTHTLALYSVCLYPVCAVYCNVHAPCCACHPSAGTTGTSLAGRPSASSWTMTAAMVPSWSGQVKATMESLPFPLCESLSIKSWCLIVASYMYVYHSAKATLEGIMSSQTVVLGLKRRKWVVTDSLESMLALPGIHLVMLCGTGLFAIGWAQHFHLKTM